MTIATIHLRYSMTELASASVLPLCKPKYVLYPNVNFSSSLFTHLQTIEAMLVRLHSLFLVQVFGQTGNSCFCESYLKIVMMIR